MCLLKYGGVAIILWLNVSIIVFEWSSDAWLTTFKSLEVDFSPQNSEKLPRPSKGSSFLVVLRPDLIKNGRVQSFQTVVCDLIDHHRCQPHWMFACSRVRFRYLKGSIIFWMLNFFCCFWTRSDPSEMVSLGAAGASVLMADDGRRDQLARGWALVREKIRRTSIRK